MKSRKDFGDNRAEAALGVILNDQLLFSLFFQKSDLSIEPTAPQKLMILDSSDRILACTSRNVAKTISLIGRVMRDIATYLPRGDKKDQEILITTPTQAQLDPLINRLLSNIGRQPFMKSLIQESNRGDKPRLLTKTRLTIHGRLEGSCLSGDSIIFDSETGIPYRIDDMVNGIRPNRIHTLNLDTWKFEETEDFGVVSNGVKKVYTITLSDGFRVKATDNHRFLTQFGWKELKDLDTEVDRIVVPKVMPIGNDRNIISGRESKLIGYITGDGNVTRRYIRFCNTDEAMVDDFSDIVHEMGGKIRPDGDYSYSVTMDGNKWHTNSITDFVRGTPEIWDKKSYQKDVPLSVYGSSLPVVSEYLSGLWNTDGTAFVSPNGSGYLEYDSTSRDLIDGIAYLLLRYGIRARIRSKQGKPNWFPKKDGTRYYCECRDSFRLITGNCNDVRIFSEHIKCDGQKQVKIDRVLSVATDRASAFQFNGVPSEIVNDEISNLWERTLGELGVETQSNLKPSRKYKTYNKSVAKRIADRIGSEKINCIIDGDTEFRQIKSIEYSGEEETYDLQVSPHHNFIANGIVVHNSGTDVNMTGIHPVKIYGDEAAFQSHINHRSRMAGAMPETKWFYAGVPNGVRTTPFYELDQTKIGNDWSHHKFSMLNSNPLFVQSRKYRNQIIKSFGGKNSPDFITQVLGEWGDEAQSSFPPGSISWTDGIPYFMARCSGADIDRAIQTGTLAKTLNNIPQVRCYRAAVGWDWGYSPDPSTFVLAYQMAENQPWRTYARVSLYQVTLPKQVEVLKHLVSVVLGYKHSMISVDNNGAYQTCLSETNKYMFDGRMKLTNQGGAVEIDSDTGTLVTPETKESYDIVNRRKEGKIVRMGRKYWLTEQLRRFMLNSILKADGVQLELGFDPDLENDFVSTVERKTASGQTIYDVPKQGKVNLDQNLDGVRALIDSIVEIERFGQPVGVDYSGMLNQLGWIGKLSKQDREDGGIKLPWDI